MLIDFGLLKKPFGELVDSFDHCHAIWSRDFPNYRNAMMTWSDRWIETPLSPSAECLSIMFFAMFEAILGNTYFANNEGPVVIDSVVVHETATGYAEASAQDVRMVEQRYNFRVADILFSEAVRKDWSRDWTATMRGEAPLVNIKPEQQV
jgi:6-pyruvoyltetrahydropterin/6-carboxytetrahydropterin synthase